MSEAVLSPNRFRAWVLAARPATLTAAVVPVAVGTACAIALGAFRAGPAAAALAGAMLIQIGTNFANDLFDHEKGADTIDRIGPTRAVATGLITPAGMRVGMIVAFGAAFCCGVYLTWVAGWPVVAIGLASIASGIAYTGGPYPLGYHGLGDLFVLLFFGFVAVCGTVYVQALNVPALAWWASVPVGCLATAVLVVNNLRDRVTDAQAGKHTLAVRLGRRGAVAEYAVLVMVAQAVPPAMWALGLAGWPVLLALVSLPVSVVRMRQVATLDGPALNPLLGGTARLLLWHGLPFAAGIAFGPALGGG